MSDNNEDTVVDSGQPLTEISHTGPSANREEAALRAREHGWKEPTAFDYAAYGYGNGTTDQQEDATVEAGPSFTWYHEASKYDWQGADPANDSESVGPPHAELESELFRSEFHNVQGDLFKDILKSEVTTIGPKSGTCPEPVKSFADMPLHWLLKQNLQLAGWTVPTPVQAAVIPIVAKGHDVVAIAQTGTGKTAAYLLPIISRLIPDSHKLCAPRPGIKGCESIVVRAEPLVVIVVPTRELAFQIFDEVRRWTYRTMLRSCIAYGGGPMGAQIRELQLGCDILIGTLGRIVDLLKRPTVLSLSRVKYNVIDEADELLSMDWESDLNRILLGGDAASNDAKYLMVSATFGRELRKVARKYLDQDNHVRVRVGRMNMVANSSSLRQTVVWVDNNLKENALYDLLFDPATVPVRTMIFVGSKRRVDQIDDFLYNAGLPVTSLHGDRTQREREDAIRAFRTGTCPILVTTSIAARGLDIKNVLNIIMYDLPSTDHDGITGYIHIIGRTSRIGNKGVCTSFYNDGNTDIAPALVKVLTESGCEVPDFLQEFVTTEEAEDLDKDEWEELSSASEHEDADDFDEGAELAEPFGSLTVTNGAAGTEGEGGFNEGAGGFEESAGGAW